jgi:nucleoside-diphosphate-sugar epimerase
VHVDDVVSAARRAAQLSGKHAHIFNISGDRQITLADTAALVRQVVPSADL